MSDSDSDEVSYSEVVEKYRKINKKEKGIILYCENPKEVEKLKACLYGEFGIRNVEVLSQKESDGSYKCSIMRKEPKLKLAILYFYYTIMHYFELLKGTLNPE